MSGYVLSILGIVMAGVIIDIVIPSGAISKYIKGVYSIFVVIVLINPLVNILSKANSFSLNYNDYQANEKLLNYIFSSKTKELENRIEKELTEQGFENVDIVLVYSIENEEIIYNSCSVNIKNMSISSDKQHINKYEFIVKVVKNHTNLTEEEIIFYEW